MKIFVLGGGCFGTQYARWLAAARERGKIHFEEIVVVDKDENCKVEVEVKVEEAEVRCQRSDWVDFLVDYIRDAGANTDDLIVPSHAAPHILGKAFLTLILRATSSLSRRSREAERGSRLRSNNKKHSETVSMFDIQTKIGTPVEKKLEKGVIAVSMATWNCPANCPEPGKCPHLHAPRGWELEMVLRNWAEKSKFDEFFVFPARHYAFAVSAIPAKTVVEAWHSLRKKLGKPGKYAIGIATASACHGILSIFRVDAEKTQ